MIINNKFKIFINILCGFLGLTLIINNARGILNNCFHATDFGIYQQAIYEIANFNGLNPYLTIRNINIFNDHFDPVIIFAVPFVWITNYHPLSLIFFELLVFSLFLFLVLKLNPYKKYNTEILLMLLTTKAFLTGLNYPIHPSTWSIIPIFLMGHYYSKNSHRGFILSAFALCFFREVFPLTLIFMSLGFFKQKKYRYFIGIFFPACFLAFMIYFFRPMFMGPVVSYGGMVLKQLFNHPIETILNIKLMPIIKVSYPFIIPFYFIIKKDKREIFANPLFLLWLPLMGLHILTNKVHSQYGAFLFAPLWTILIFSPYFKDFLENKKAVVLTMILFIASSLGTYTKDFKLAYLGQSKKCILSKEKTQAMNKLIGQINMISEEQTVLATGGIIPLILKPKMKVFQAGLFSRRLAYYDYLLFEKNGSGDIFPFSNLDIKKTINECQYDIIENNDFYFLAKGPIPAPCLKPLWEAWP